MTTRDDAARGLLAIRHRAGLLAGLERIRPEWIDDSLDLAAALTLMAPESGEVITADLVRARAAGAAIAAHVASPVDGGIEATGLPTDLEAAARRALTPQFGGTELVDVETLFATARRLAAEFTGPRLVRELLLEVELEPRPDEHPTVVSGEPELTVALPDAPCTARLVPCRGALATWIAAEHSVTADFTPDQLARMTDPGLWPRVNPFFQDVTWLAGGPTTADATRSWSGTVLERVGLPARPLTTALDVRCDANEHHVVLTYRLAGDPGHRRQGDGDIDVDSGYLAFRRPDRTRRPLDGDPLWTISSLKYVHFSRSANEPASFACQLGWADLIAQMALAAAEFSS
jgi:hypothetical protein